MSLNHLRCILPLLAALGVLTAISAFDQSSAAPGPGDILRKAIPDKLIVLTFDDAPASHATVVAPILKEMGFGGSIYVCDFDSFKTRKDWYLTYRQMNAMHADGLEIGNHTVGHYGGYEPFLAMEDQVLANGGPRMTTLCWPVYAVNWDDCPKLAAHGYTFGRGGHERAYRPTVDHPFDVPSFSITDGVPMETFIRQAQQACDGRVVVFTFHGVPDMEHPPVSLKPSRFREMMQYLKDNDYHCVAMRDLAHYIDPEKAAKLPRTVDTFKAGIPGRMILTDKPYIPAPGNEMLEFSFPDLPGAKIADGVVEMTVPHATNVTALEPRIKLSAGATVIPASGARRDFSSPQRYIITGQDGSTKSYLVTVKKTPAGKAKEFLTFSLPGAPGIARSGNRICLHVPTAMNVKSLAPVFTLPAFASAVPASGTALDFTIPQTYTLTAQDGSSADVIVTVIKSDQPRSFAWSKAEDGNWSDRSRWSSGVEAGSATAIFGQPGAILNFDQGGPCKVNNDLKAGFPLNQLVFGSHAGGLVLSGNGVTFAREKENNMAPVIHARKCQRVDINMPVILADDLTVKSPPDKDPNSFLSFHEVISGPGALTLSSVGDADVAGINFHDVHYGILQINHPNTYSGGTLISGGKVNVRETGGLGSGTVTLENFGTLSADRDLSNPVVINDGMLLHCTLSGRVTLNANAAFIGNCTISGSMSGPGGFTMYGTNGTYLNMVPGGVVTLHGANSYAGPTTIFPGTLIVTRAAALYNADPAKWTPENITIHKAATLRLNVGGAGEFSGEQVGTLLGNLTRVIHGNGLMGGSALALDTGNAKEPVTVSAGIADSSGPGGGAFLLRKCGNGELRLSGSNTYAGRTILESGTLSVASLNSFSAINRRASSSLGVPADIESGEIVVGEQGKDSQCSLIFTGSGETTDRVINLAGKDAALTIQHSGTGILKFTSAVLISGYGADKSITLTGDTAGTGEFAGTLTDPHDRTGKATTSISKTGSGKWILSGQNTFSGTTTVMQGTLVLASTRSLDPRTNVHVAAGAVLELNFTGQMKVRSLSLDGKAQPAGVYSKDTRSASIVGSGALIVETQQ